MSPCPSAEQLALLLDERLGAGEADAVTAHVQGCRACQQTLDSLAAAGSLDLGPPTFQLGPENVSPLAPKFVCQPKTPMRGHAVSGDPGNRTPTPSTAGETWPNVAGYEILAELGRGGMGVVYKARQARLGRVVALKMLLAGAHAGAQELARFRVEAEAVARLQHPNIVQIFEVGEEKGSPYLALEYVEGGSLSDKLKGTPLPARAAAELVEALALAIDAAHRRGIVHRDLKPANILLTPDGNAKVTDFGLAKRLDAATVHTQSGALLGTPDYMAPEQAAGKTIGPAADVYGLGAILYHLLTGRPPFPAETPLDTLVRLQSEEPVPPSVLQPKVPRDLATICLKALAKEPGRRFASGGDLAEDLRRFLDGRPIQARPAGRVEKWWRWCRRNPALATASSLALAAGVAVVVVSVSFAIYQSQAAAELGTALEEVKTKERLATENSRKLKAALGEVKDQQRLASENAKKAETQRDRAASRLAAHYLDRGLVSCTKDGDVAVGLHWMSRALEAVPENDNNLRQVIQMQWAGWKTQVHPLKCVFSHLAQGNTMAFSPDGKTVLTGCLDGARLWSADTGKELIPCLRHQNWVRAVAFSPDGKTILTGSDDWTARLWSAATGKELTPPLRHQRRINALAFSPDGKVVVTASQDGTARLWSAATGKQLTPALRHQGWVQAVAFGPDGKTVLTGSDDQTARLWSMASGKELTPPLRHSGWVRAVAFSPDGKTILTGSDKTARLWSATTGKVLTPALPEVPGAITVAVFSPDGNAVLVCGLGCMARLYSATTGKAVTPPFPHGRSSVAAFSPDGKVVLTGSSDGTARFWSATTGSELGPPLRHRAPIFTVGFSPNGEVVFTGSTDGTGRLWSAAPGNELTPPLRHNGPVDCAAISSSGKVVVTGGMDRAARLWSSATGKQLTAPMYHEGSVHAVAFCPKSMVLLAVSGNKVQLWSRATGKRLTPPLLHPGFVTAAAFSPDGKTVITGSGDKTARLWSAATGKELTLAFRHQNQVNAVAFSFDGKMILTCSHATVRLWSAATGKELTPPLLRPHQILTVGFSPDSKAVATGCAWTARLWSTATGKQITPPLRHQDVISVVAFSPDGKTVLTGSDDWTARLWSTSTGKELTPPLRHQGFVRAVAFSPDGGAVVTGSSDSTARLWSTTTGQELMPPMRHLKWVTAVAFSRDGKAVLTASNDCTARLWRIPTLSKDDSKRAKLWTQVLTGLEMDENGDIVFLNAPRWQARAQQFLHEAQHPAFEQEHILAWHWRHAIESEISGQWFAAAWHLRRLLPPEEAVKLLTPCDDPYHGLFLAMAHHRLGHTQEAKGWLHKAIGWLDQPDREQRPHLASNRLACQTLRREAENLILPERK
jgi:WD40 repeat protein/tRNA A-37 threonylcarbamoyl transferase component Bud32